VLYTDLHAAITDGTAPRLIQPEGGGPIWARFYQIGTNRPIFSNRDRVILYDWHEVDDERRRGYAWYRTAPAGMLREYERWARRFPAPRWGGRRGESRPERRAHRLL
jgi:hypothetical protein